MSVTELIQSVVSLLLQRPDDARRRPSDYLTNLESYEAVFGADKYSLSIYLQCVLILRRVQQYIQQLKDLDRAEKQNFKFYVAMLAVCRLTNKSKSLSTDLEKISISNLNDNFLLECLQQIQKISKDNAKDGEGIKGLELLEKMNEYLSKIYETTI